ncbi:MAG: hypothetical protein GX149_02375, partial [Acholeplasmataceae bacterium]|nr:hypothetical protein [Acholeplasmataceae bacterium]
MRFAKWIFSLILVFVLVSCEKSATYKVLFETNSDLILSTVEVENNKKLEEPNQLVKEGYEFLGWYTDIDFSSKWDFEKNAVKSNLVLYAKWEKLTFEVSFDVDGGSTVEPKTIGYDEFISKPKNPTKEGYSFDGWFKDEEYQEEWDFLADSIRAKTIIYAKWIEREFVVSFNTLDGKDGEELYLDYNSLIPEPSLPSRTGHVFLGWFKAIDYEEEWDFNNDVVKADTILYAKWDPALFTVSFENVEDYETKTIEYGKLIARPEEPTKANHRFGGWFIDDELKIAWNFEAPILKNMILYAKWTELQGATIYGNRDLEIRLEELENLDFSVGVIAKDDSGEDLTSEIVIDTSGIKAEPGVYEINYSVTDGAGSITKVTSMLTIQEATRKEPYLDTRDFESKESRIANTVVNVDYSYDEIIYTVDVYEGYGQNGRLQVLKNIEGYFEKGKKYVVSLVAQASKKTKIQPYLQKDPVKSPWTNVMANPYFEVDEEPRVIQFVFELEEVFDIYVFSIEFGNAF